MPSIQPFHLAMPVDDLQAARAFYTDLLGCEEGRSSKSWVDFNFFGHQFVVHLQDKQTSSESCSNAVDNIHVPVPHFGVVLLWQDWQALADKLTQAGVEFIVEPYIRFKGEVGEQGTFFLNDPSGNALEFKTFKDMQQLFAK